MIFVDGTGRSRRILVIIGLFVAEGHEIGVQSFSDADLWSLPAWQRALEIRLGPTRSPAPPATARESLRPLWTFPLQQVVYRQITYLVVLQSAVTACAGIA